MHACFLLGLKGWGMWGLVGKAEGACGFASTHASLRNLACRHLRCRFHMPPLHTRLSVVTHNPPGMSWASCRDGCVTRLCTNCSYGMTFSKPNLLNRAWDSAGLTVTPTCVHARSSSGWQGLCHRGCGGHASILKQQQHAAA